MAEPTGKFYGLFPSLLMQKKISSPGSDLNKQLRTELEAVRAITPNGQPLHSASQSYTTLETDDQLHRRSGLAGLVALVFAQAQHYAEKSLLDLSVGDLRIHGCWLTVLSKDEAIEMHTNANSIFTAIYFVETPPEGSALRFYSSVGENWPDITPVETTPMNTRSEVVKAVAGDLAVFPSNLINEMRRHSSDVDHVSLTFTFDVARRDLS
ncbi:MAG: hypothetical protein ACJAU6_002285 [Alphaproteobacteria bacterium]